MATISELRDLCDKSLRRGTQTVPLRWSLKLTDKEFETGRVEVAPGLVARYARPFHEGAILNIDTEELDRWLKGTAAAGVTSAEPARDEAHGSESTAPVSSSPGKVHKYRGYTIELQKDKDADGQRVTSYAIVRDSDRYVLAGGDEPSTFAEALAGCQMTIDEAIAHPERYFESDELAGEP